MYTKIMQNTKFVYILYTKITQIKILYDKECTKNIHQILTYIQKNVQTVQNLCKVQTKNGLKLEIYVFCTYKQCKNYTKCTQMLIESYMWLLMYVIFIYKKPTFFTFHINNDVILSSVLFRTL